MPITKAEIFAINTLPRELVLMPEWGGSVYVKTLTAGQAMNTLKRVQNDQERAFAHWIVDTVCNEDGTLVFDPADPADIDRLFQQPMLVVQRLVDTALRLNVGRAEEAQKNSAAIHSDNSSSPSPSVSVAA